MADALTELIERMRLLEVDHEPDGWPAVRMRDITALVDALEAARGDGCVSLVVDIRWACGDKGKRMQQELVEFIRALAADAERWRFCRALMTFPVFGYFRNPNGDPEWGICVRAGVTHTGSTPEAVIDASRSCDEVG